jgi:hypothetical protein
MTDEHSDGTYHEELSTAETINKEDGREGEKKIDHSKDASGK